MRKTVIRILFCLLLGSPVLYAQTPSSEDFPARFREAESATADSTKARKILDTYQEYMSERLTPESYAFSYLKKALDISEKANYTLGKLRATYSLASDLNYSVNNINTSIEYFIKCRKIAEESGNTNYQAKAIMGIGLIHFKQQRWQQALLKFRESLAIGRALNIEFRIAVNQYLIGLCLLKTGKFTGSLLYLDSAMSLYRKINNLQGQVECAINKGFAWLNLNQTDSARQLFGWSLKKYHEYKKEPFWLLLAQSGMAQLELQQNHHKQALQIALSIRDSVDYLPAGMEVINEYYLLLSKCYLANGDYRNAHLYLQKFHDKRDSFTNLDISSRVLELQAEYDFDKKTAAAKAQQLIKETALRAEIQTQKNARIFFLILACVLALSVLLIISAYRAVSRQRRLSDRLLLNILPKETAAELKEHGTAVPKRHENVAIMFCDIRDFTVISEKLAPETLVKRLDTYFREFDRIISHYGMEKIKTIGDAYMCVAGLQPGANNPSVQAVKAAKDILNTVSELAGTMPQGEAFEFRVGIHTGPVVSGVVGMHKYAYDIWGDSVNTAARMEQNSIPGRINITGATHEQVKDQFNCEFRGMIDAKNKGQIEMYFVK